jgi:hypothetical protein
VLVRFLADCFEGTLVSDFFSSYNAIFNDRQACLAHLLRELKKVGKTNFREEWKEFDRILKRLLKDAIRLSRRADREAPAYDRKVRLIHNRLDELIGANHRDADCRRLVKRLIKHRYSLLTFLDDAWMSFDNNRAERETRPAVIARKNSFHNTSDQGAWTQAVLMTIYRTLELRGQDPIETISDTLTLFIAAGKLPDLPTAKPLGWPPANRPADSGCCARSVSPNAISTPCGKNAWVERFVLHTSKRVVLFFIHRTPRRLKGYQELYPPFRRNHEKQIGHTSECHFAASLHANRLLGGGSSWR